MVKITEDGKCKFVAPPLKWSLISKELSKSRFSKEFLTKKRKFLNNATN